MQAVRIALRLAVADLHGQMQYRADFMIQIVVGIVWQCTGFLFIWVVLSTFHAIAGWTLGELAFLYALRLCAHALHSVFFIPIDYLGRLVRLGDLDRYLVRPLPVLLQIVSSHISMVIFGDAISALILFCAATRLVTVQWSPLSVTYLLLAMVGGCLIETALKLIASALSFRALNADALCELINSTFATFGNYPLKIYNAPMRVALTALVPVAFVAYLPATVLLNRTGEIGVPLALAYLAPLVGALWFAAAYLFFMHELGHYQSSGH